MRRKAVMKDGGSEVGCDGRLAICAMRLVVRDSAAVSLRKGKFGDVGESLARESIEFSRVREWENECPARVAGVELMVYMVRRGSSYEAGLLRMCSRISA